jgi:hypothetical protein
VYYCFDSSREGVAYSFLRKKAIMPLSPSFGNNEPLPLRAYEYEGITSPQALERFVTPPLEMPDIPRPIPASSQACDHKASERYYFVTPDQHIPAFWCADCGSMKFGASERECTWHVPTMRTVSVVPQNTTIAAPILSADVLALIEANKGIFLDLGCSDHKSPGSVGMDVRAVEGVDIVHDLEVFPWPLPDACCSRILCSHLIEHIKPWLTVSFLNECWRVMRPQGQLLLATPYAGSPRFWQDPTHVHGWMEATPQYFSCDFPLWLVYHPQCWTINENYWDSVGDLHVIMSKRTEGHGQYHPMPGT